MNYKFQNRQFVEEFNNLKNNPNLYTDTNYKSFFFIGNLGLILLFFELFITFIFLVSMSSIYSEQSIESSIYTSGNIMKYTVIYCLGCYLIGYLTKNKNRSYFESLIYSGKLSDLFSDLNHVAISSRKEDLLYEYDKYYGFTGKTVLEIFFEIDAETITKSKINKNPILIEIDNIK